MQIQRIQTLYLILAIICVAVIFFMPVAYYVGLTEPKTVVGAWPGALGSQARPAQP